MKFGKRLRVAMFGLAASLVLSACGGTENTGSGPATEGPTRVVVDAEGTEVTVPEHPERVVVLSEPTMDGTLALGVTPIGAVTGRGQQTVPNYLADVASDLPILGGIAQPNFEAIGAAKPDLILVDGRASTTIRPWLRHFARLPRLCTPVMPVGTGA